jgi:hypothetical protein
MPLQRLFPPLAGVSEDNSYTDQEPATARDAENVVSLEPHTGRTRLTKRPGLKKFMAAQLGTGKVRDLAQIVYNDLTVDYASLAVPTQEWVTTAATLKGANRLRVSARGDIFVVEKEDGDTVTRLNADGVIVSQIPLDNDESVGIGPYFQCIALGNDDSIFVALGTLGTGVSGSWIRILRYALGTDGDYFKAWTVKSGDDAPNNGLFVKAMTVKKGRLYTLQQADVANTPLRLRVYGQIYGTVTPKLAVDYTFLATAVGNVARGIDVDDAGNIFVSYITTGDQHFAKISPNGATLWTVTASTAGRGGMGNAIAVRDGKIWTQGFPQGANTQWLSQYTDGAVAPTHNWSIVNANAESKAFQLIVVDKFLNVHSALPRVTHVAGDDIFGYSTAAGALIYSLDSPASLPVNSVGIPPTNPDQVASAVPPNRPEFLYFAAQGGNYYKYRLFTATASTGSTRTFKYIGVSDDDIETFTSLGVASPSGGSAVVNQNAQYIQSVVMLGKWYLADGQKYFVYDPVTDTVSVFLSSTSGVMPPRCRLIETWRSRLVLAGDPDNRHALYLSAQGDASDWDFYPPTPTSKQAIWTTLAPQLDGVADIINCLVPYSNDWMLVGCDHSIHLLRGDPAAGGSMDLITNEGGMAWGRPYCFGPDGELYYFAQQGGVYVMAPGLSLPQRLTERRLERQLSDIDLSTHYARLAWDHRQQSLVVALCPYGAGGTSIRGWFWNRKHAAWWPMRFGSTAQTGVQPTAVLTSDADDPDDRLIVFGCEDGYVRRLDEAVAYDELSTGVQQGIGSYVVLGPFSSEDRMRHVKVKSVWGTLASAGQVVAQLFTQARPDAGLTIPAKSAVLRPGFNARTVLRGKGTTCYVKLTDAAASLPWSIESLALEVEMGGRERRKL